MKCGYNVCKISCGNNYDISICICSYNVEKYISSCLNSILNQLCNCSFEIVIVDDSSVDNTRKIIYRFLYEYNNITLVNMDCNSGPGICRNIALDYAKGEYVLAVDSDDYLDKSALNKLFAVAKKTGCDAVVGGVDYVSETSEHLGYFNAANNLYNVRPDKNFDVFLRCTGYHWSILIKKKVIEQNNIKYGENVICGTDGHFLFKLVNYLNNVSIINDIVYYYRQVPTSIDHKKRTLRYFIDQFNAYEILLYNIKFNYDLYIKRFILDMYNVFTNKVNVFCQENSDEDIKCLFDFYHEKFEQYKLADIIIEFCVVNEMFYKKDLSFFPRIIAFQSGRYELFKYKINCDLDYEHYLSLKKIVVIFMKKLFQKLKGSAKIID